MREREREREGRGRQENRIKERKKMGVIRRDRERGKIASGKVKQMKEKESETRKK